MSQIASFTYLNARDVALLGFWSKPKPRLFQKPENKFPEFLQQHGLRESVFDRSDGVYVALVFAWLESKDKSLTTDADPVVATLRKNLEGSYWLVKFGEGQVLSLVEQSLPKEQWPGFLKQAGVGDAGAYVWTCFDDARRFVHERISEIQASEALLVSVG